MSSPTQKHGRGVSQKGSSEVSIGRVRSFFVLKPPRPRILLILSALQFAWNWSGCGSKCVCVEKKTGFRGAPLNWFHTFADSDEVIHRREGAGAGDLDNARISYILCCCHYRQSYLMTRSDRRTVCLTRTLWGWGCFGDGDGPHIKTSR